MDAFGIWIVEQMEARGWRTGELARAMGANKVVVSRIIHGGRGIGMKTARAMAKAFDMPMQEIFQHSGILPPPPKLTRLGDRVMTVVAGMTPSEIEDLLEYAALIKRRRKRKRDA